MKAPKTSIDKNKKYSAVLHTEKGDITISLNSDQTPKTVSNFVTLAKKGFYNKTIFHRIIKGFMIQEVTQRAMEPADQGISLMTNLLLVNINGELLLWPTPDQILMEVNFYYACR